MEKYTKGNWRAIVVDNHGKPIQSCVVVDTLAGDFIMVADTNRSLPMAECAANARLIASAPDMLEALKRIKALLADAIKIERDGEADSTQKEISDIYLDIRDVIYKAEGRE